MFDTILRELLETVPGTRGVVFCDRDGETVNSVGASGRHAPEMFNDYELRVAGAQLATPLYLAQTRWQESLGALRECVIAGGAEILLIHMLPDGYYLLMCLDPGTLVSRAMQRLRQTAVKVAIEMM